MKKTKKKLIKEYLKNARLQRYWASLALTDKKYSEKRIQKLKKTKPISTQNLKREAKVCKFWAKKRLHWAKQYENKAKRLMK